MRDAATILGLEDDSALYTVDIDLFTNALQEHAWDEKAGYFSYVIHDENGNPEAFLRDKSGINYNRGMDGLVPLFAGICTDEQRALLLQRLQDTSQFWTPIGLSTIDQSAPYYRKDGYWNGSVWMPHQWFFWKTALDLGEGDFAFQIAQTALNLWKQEVEASYYCFEHFIIQTERGAGWHQFSGLSSPVLSWFNSYYRLGKLTTGMDTWIVQKTLSDNCLHLQAELYNQTTSRTSTVLANMQSGYEYRVLWNGETVPHKVITDCCLQIDLPFNAKVGTIEIKLAE